MKKRSPIISIELGEDVRIEWNDKENCIELLNSSGEISAKHHVHIAEAYPRVKGPKVVRQVENPPGAAIYLSTSSVSYDRYMAVDTSYKKFGENYMCVAAALCSDHSFRHTKATDEVSLRVYPRECFLSRRGINPERYGWKIMIEALIKTREFDPNLSYGVIVDSDLDSLPKINSRETSILDDFVLPANISMIYASADSAETFLNKLIKETDRIAKRSLKTALEWYGGDESYVLESDFLLIGDQLMDKDNIDS
jgi:hypothetical protein